MQPVNESRLKQMSRGNGDLRMIALATTIIAASGCGSPQHRGGLQYELPMQCYKENVLKTDVSSILLQGAINAAINVAKAGPHATNLHLENNYYSWGRCLDMFSWSTSYPENETDETVKYNWVPPYVKLVQINSSKISPSAVIPGDSAIVEIIYQVKARQLSKRSM